MIFFLIRSRPPKGSVTLGLKYGMNEPIVGRIGYQHWVEHVPHGLQKIRPSSRLRGLDSPLKSLLHQDPEWMRE